MKQLFFYSIKPLTFFLPSIYHPIFGPFTKGWIGSIFYGENPCEAALYLGFIPLILAAIAFKQWRRDKDYYKGFFIFLFLASILFTLPPYLKAGNFKILFPSYFMYRLIPLFRNPVRFGLITILSIAALAGIGLKIILTRIDLKRTRFLFVSVVIIGVLFEIINIPPFHVTDISKIPPVYKWLSEQKRDFAIAEYPLLRDPGVNGRYIFYQRIHKKPLVNGAGIADMEAYNIKKIIFRITDPRTPSTLSWLGAKYAIVHLEDLKKSESLDIIGVLPDLKKIKGLKFIKSFPGVEVYEVTAQPRKPNIE